MSLKKAFGDTTGLAYVVTYAGGDVDSMVENMADLCVQHGINVQLHGVNGQHAEHPDNPYIHDIQCVFADKQSLSSFKKNVYDPLFNPSQRLGAKAKLSTQQNAAAAGIGARPPPQNRKPDEAEGQELERERTPVVSQVAERARQIAETLHKSRPHPGEREHDRSPDLGMG